MGRKQTIKRRKIPITQLKVDGSTIKRIPSSLKPARTRKLIRRFHTLLKYRSEIFSHLSQNSGYEVNDKSYLEYLGTKPDLQKSYNKSKAKIMETLNVRRTAPRNDENRSIQAITTLNIKQLCNLIGEIDGEIEKRGGLKVYQAASIKGQDNKRGGDTSKKMVTWIKESKIWSSDSSKGKPMALEIGSLSSKNCISTCKLFEKVIRIDLNSQEPVKIQKQDFFDRPLPKSDKDKFDLISCSLVVNFVSKPKTRGEMLAKATQFLKEPDTAFNQKPLLFFVIPLPCVTNSRYCNKEIIDTIFENLGFECVNYYTSNKLAYWLLEWHGSKAINLEFESKKKEIQSGSKRNNFCIVLGKRAAQ